MSSPAPWTVGRSSPAPWPSAALACEGYEGDSITEWEALTPVPHGALRTLLDAVRGMHLDPDEETLLRSAWSVLDEAERETRND